jgi:hypothetical protein
MSARASISVVEKIGMHRGPLITVCDTGACRYEMMLRTGSGNSSNASKLMLYFSMPTDRFAAVNA